MKTLAIILASLLAVGSLNAQQMVQQRAPNFYVPYSVTAALAQEHTSDSSSTSEGESSSADASAENPLPLPDSPPPQCQCPRHGMHSHYGAPYSPYRTQSFSNTGLVVLSVIMIGLLVAGLTAGD